METFDFVRDKLSEWGLSKWIQRFEDEGIDKESFLSLEESEITALIPKIGPAKKFRNRHKEFLQKEQRAAGHDRDDPAQEEQGAAANSAQIGPSTSNFSPPPVTVKGKRKSESSKQEVTSSKRHCGSVSGTSSEEQILAEMKEIIKRVRDKMNKQVNTKFNAFLKQKLVDLESDKKQLVGVIGKTGDGKSSLINAIIGENDLLPSGSGSACTSVMIKVEANMSDSEYMAEIEFITKQEWKDELCSLSKKYFPGDNVNEENEDGDDGDDGDDDDGGDDDDDEKLSALYGKDFKKSWTELMENKHFSEIPEFLKCRKKRLIDESALKLSDKLAKYIRSDEEETGRQYWPLVKCVTIKVPNVTDLLEHVTLVDLPGSGDCNKSRDEMWKEFVGSCSTVWIVTDINRAASKKEPWEILDNTISLMGNGGECRSISFICTKSDVIKDTRVIPTEEGRACILKRNKQTKERVREKFNKQNNIKKHFSGDSDDFFQVFTVSSTEFQKEVFLQKDETEIPKLQECLLNFNDRQSKISNYVSEAYGILSLIHGANSSKMAFHKPLLQQRLKDELDKVRQSMEKAYRAFENCLGEGVKKSQESYAKKMRFILVPKKGKDRGFHRTLKSLVENDGIYKPKTKPEININVTLASCMRDHIDEEFKQTFPNKERCGPFKGAINTFTLGTESLVDRDKDVSLQLTFLKTEEAKLKTKLNNHIRENKKKIYSSLPNSIKDSMRPCYDEAAGYRGKDTLKNMRNAIETHLKVSQNIMFSKAKDDMLDQMKRLMDHILNKLEKDMKSSINLSLKADNAIPDVTDEYARGKKCHDKLMDKSNKETPMTCVESLKPKAAPDVKSVTHAQEHILKRPAQDTKKSIKLSRMKTDDNSVSDVTEQYQRGKKYHDKQMGSHKKHPPMACVEPLKPEAASDFQSVTHAQEHILKSPEQDMKKSSELSLKMDDNSVPDVTEQYQRGKKYHDKQMGNPNKETPLTCVEPLKPKAASDFQSVTHAQSHVSSVTVLNPRILHETDDHKPSYRLDCPEAGLFQCASTGLVFEMEKKGEVFYRTVDWDSFPHTLTPAGPLFSIQCTCVRQLHLPHCETLSDDPDMLLVARVIDGKLEEVQPNRMTTTHVIVDVTTFTQHGLFRKSFSHHPVQGQVLLFHQKAANRPQRCTLNVLLLPRNVPICEVKSHQRGFNLLQSSSSTLSPRGRYGLGCDLVERAEIQPKSGTFACDYSRNYQSTFQVLLDSGAKTVRLILMDRGNNDRSVWECVVPLAAAPGFEVPQIAPTLGTTSEFVQRHRNVLIKRVSEVMPIADDLLVEEVITDETYDKIKNAPTSQTQMRELLAVVCRAGSAAMSEFYKALKQNQPRLVKDLEKPSQM